MKVSFQSWRTGGAVVPRVTRMSSSFAAKKKPNMMQFYSKIGVYFLIAEKVQILISVLQNIYFCWKPRLEKLRLQFISTRAPPFTFVLLHPQPSPHFFFFLPSLWRKKTTYSFPPGINTPTFTENNMWVDNLLSQILGAKCVWNSEFFNFRKVERSIFHKSLLPTAGLVEALCNQTHEYFLRMTISTKWGK